jgi:hypothetical protein
LANIKKDTRVLDMKYKFFPFLIVLIFLISCDGIKHICLYNLSQEAILITTSRVRTDLPAIYLERYPEIRLEPSDTMTEISRIKYYNRLFETNNNLIESPKGIEFVVKPNTSIKIGGGMWAAFPEKIKPKDLYIDSMTIKTNSDTVKAENRIEIIELTNDIRFKYRKTDKEYIKLNNRLFKNIVIR